MKIKIGVIRKKEVTMKVKTSMLEYSKNILKKVSFDYNLFEKELKKALTYLQAEEIKKLENWCLSKFNRGLSMITLKVINKQGRLPRRF